MLDFDRFRNSLFTFSKGSGLKHFLCFLFSGEIILKIGRARGLETEHLFYAALRILAMLEARVIWGGVGHSSNKNTFLDIISLYFFPQSKFKIGETPQFSNNPVIFGCLKGFFTGKKHF